MSICVPKQHFKPDSKFSETQEQPSLFELQQPCGVSGTLTPLFHTSFLLGHHLLGNQMSGIIIKELSLNFTIIYTNKKCQCSNLFIYLFNVYLLNKFDLLHSL